MGRRSRKRGAVARAGTAGPPPPDAPRRAPVVSPDRRARRLEAPKAPWAPVPLGELAILAGIVLIVAGFVTGSGGSPVLLAVGFGLVCVAALELALREHLAGYRSHSTLLAASVAIALVVPLYFLTSLPSEVLLILGVVFFAAAFQGLRTVFAHRTGGLGFRA